MDKVDLGLRAKTVLDFTELWDALDAECVAAMLSAEPGDAETLISEHQRYVVLQDTKATLQAWYEEAQSILAEDQGVDT